MHHSDVCSQNLQTTTHSDVSSQNLQTTTQNLWRLHDTSETLTEVCSPSASCGHFQLYTSHVVQTYPLPTKQHDDKSFRQLPSWLHLGFAWHRTLYKTIAMLTTTCKLWRTRWHANGTSTKQHDDESLRQLPSWLHLAFAWHRTLYKTIAMMTKAFGSSQVGFTLASHGIEPYIKQLQC